MSLESDIQIRKSDGNSFDVNTNDFTGTPIRMYSVVTPTETMVQYFEENEPPIIIEPGRKLVVVGCADDDINQLWLNIDDFGPWVNAHICLPTSKLRYLCECGDPLHMAKFMIRILNLSVSVSDKPILKGLTLEVPAGEVHAIMGPNGAGKSTLGYSLAGRPNYEVTGGSVTFKDEDLLEKAVHERAAAGLYLSFQYPLEIPGVPALTFLRTALNAQRKQRGEEEVSATDFLKEVKSVAKTLKIDMEMLKRPLNVGFSGGEKKRMEVLQMALLKPSFLILDETDSGLDIDALKVVSDGVNALRSPDRAMLVITHYQRLLDHIKPDRIHILVDGKIVHSGGPELAYALEANGYDAYLGQPA